MVEKKPDLRVVRPDQSAPGGRPAPVKRVVPQSLVDATEGDRWAFLAAMRKTLVEKIEGGDIASNSIGATFKELREIDRLIRLEERAREGGVDGGDPDEDEEFDPLAI